MTLIFTSAAAADTAKKLLAERYIDSSPTLSPAVTAFRGGGQALRLSDESFLPEALALLKGRALPPAGVFKEP